MKFFHLLKRALFPPPTVFLSSTFENLYVERIAIASELQNFRVIKMEDFWSDWLREGNPFDPTDTFGPRSSSSWIRSGIRSSDVVVVLLGGDKGSLDPETFRHYTEVEIELAVRIARKLFIYKLHRPFPDAEWLQTRYAPAEACPSIPPPVPDYIPIKDHFIYRMAPRMAENSRQMRDGKFPQLKYWRENNFPKIDHDIKVPFATDIYSAAEMLKRIRQDVASTVPGIHRGLLAPYLVIACTILIIIFLLFKH